HSGAIVPRPSRNHQGRECTPIPGLSSNGISDCGILVSGNQLSAAKQLPHVSDRPDINSKSNRQWPNTVYLSVAIRHVLSFDTQPFARPDVYCHHLGTGMD